MTEREMLLRAVCENPDEDTPRLVFADWLEENGEEERAEFIRLQIKLEAMDGSGGLEEEAWQEWQRLSARQLRLYFAHEGMWLKELPVDSGYRFGSGFRRGFAEEVEILDWAAFVRGVELIFWTAPIQTVKLQCPSVELATAPEVVRLFANLRTLVFSRNASLSAADLVALLTLPFRRLDRLTLNGPIERHLCDRLRARFGDRVSCFAE